VTDILADIFGYDKYSEITSEYSIRGTYCDLAIKTEDDVKLLIEVKAAGINLKELHMKQAADYGANEGIDWVVLTNGVRWEIYKIIFSKPVDRELICEFSLTEMNAKKANDMELLYLLSRESTTKKSKDSLEDYRAQKQLVNKFVIGQILISDAVADVIRKTIKKISPDAKPEKDEIIDIVYGEIIKREVLDSEKMSDAKRKVNKAMKPTHKKSASNAKNND
jgi:predicted type IV restriction endonuclease